MKRIVSTENYIGALKMCLSVRDDFKDLKYYRSAKGEEYAVMSDIIGQVRHGQSATLKIARLF